MNAIAGITGTPQHLKDAPCDSYLLDEVETLQDIVRAAIDPITVKSAKDRAWIIGSDIFGNHAREAWAGVYHQIVEDAWDKGVNTSDGADAARLETAFLKEVIALESIIHTSDDYLTIKSAEERLYDVRIDMKTIATTA